jgi:hypothetical protein
MLEIAPRKPLASFDEMAQQEHPAPNGTPAD